MISVQTVWRGKRLSRSLDERYRQALIQEPRMLVSVCWFMWQPPWNLFRKKTETCPKRIKLLASRWACILEKSAYRLWVLFVDWCGGHLRFYFINPRTLAYLRNEWSHWIQMRTKWAVTTDSSLWFDSRWLISLAAILDFYREITEKVQSKY